MATNTPAYFESLGYLVEYKPDVSNPLNRVVAKMFKTNFKIGDQVVRLTKPSSVYSTLKKGAITQVVHASNDGSYVGTEYVYGQKDYAYVYEQKIKVTDSKQTYNGSGFALVKGSNSMIMIEADRPTFVREFKEVTVDGKVEREYVGEWTPFKNLSAAQVYCSNSISDAIRSTNTYRKFSILIEKAVAQAKKPEIEFA